MSDQETRARAQKWFEAKYGPLIYTAQRKQVMPLCDIPNELSEFLESERQASAGETREEDARIAEVEEARYVAASEQCETYSGMSSNMSAANALRNLAAAIRAGGR